MKKIAVIGYGKIGQKVEETAKEEGIEVPVIIKHSEVKATGADSCLNRLIEKKVDLAVICISTLDGGEAAYSYIRKLLENNIPVVTSEKGAFGNYPELIPYIKKIGYSSVVGGGTGMLHWIQDRMFPGVENMHFILNGTLNYIFDGLIRGRPINEVIREVQRLGYAEPGASDPFNIIRGEVSDTTLKTASLINICGFDEVRAKDFELKDLSDEDIERLIREAYCRKYIVSMTKKKTKENIIGGFNLAIKDWYVSAGFKDCRENPLFLQLVPPGVNNAALMHAKPGTYILTGPGAGIDPTVIDGIMRDVRNML